MPSGIPRQRACRIGAGEGERGRRIGVTFLYLLKGAPSARRAVLPPRPGMRPPAGPVRSAAARQAAPRRKSASPVFSASPVPDVRDEEPSWLGRTAYETLGSHHGASLEEQGADWAIAGRSTACPIRWPA